MLLQRRFLRRKGIVVRKRIKMRWPWSVVNSSRYAYSKYKCNTKVKGTDWKDGQQKYNLTKLGGIWKLQIIMYKQSLFFFFFGRGMYRQDSVCLPAIMNRLRSTWQSKNSSTNLSTYRQRKEQIHIRDVYFMELKIAIHKFVAS